MKEYFEVYMKEKQETLKDIRSKNRCKNCPLCIQGFSGELKDSEQIIDSLRKSLKSKEVEVKSNEKLILSL